MLPHDRLSRNEHEGVLDEPPDVVASFMLGPLERIGAEVEQRRQAKLNHRLRPDVEPMRLLFHEDRLPLVVAKSGEVAVVGPVEELAALVGALAGEKVALIVAVEVNLEVLPGGVITRQQLVLDVGLTGRRDQRWRPVLCRKNVVDLGSRRAPAQASAPSPERDSRLPSWCSSRP